MTKGILPPDKTPSSRPFLGEKYTPEIHENKEGSRFPCTYLGNPRKGNVFLRNFSNRVRLGLLANSISVQPLLEKRICAAARLQSTEHRCLSQHHNETRCSSDTSAQHNVVEGSDVGVGGSVFSFEKISETPHFRNKINGFNPLTTSCKDTTFFFNPTNSVEAVFWPIASFCMQYNPAAVAQTEQDQREDETDKEVDGILSVFRGKTASSSGVREGSNHITTTQSRQACEDDAGLENYGTVSATESCVSLNVTNPHSSESTLCSQPLRGEMLKDAQDRKLAGQRQQEEQQHKLTGEKKVSQEELQRHDIVIEQLHAEISKAKAAAAALRRRLWALQEENERLMAVGDVEGLHRGKRMRDMCVNLSTAEYQDIYHTKEDSAEVKLLRQKLALFRKIILLLLQQHQEVKGPHTEQDTLS